MRRQHSIGAARNNLPTLVRQAEAGVAIELTRRGEGVQIVFQGDLFRPS